MGEICKFGSGGVLNEPASLLWFSSFKMHLPAAEVFCLAEQRFLQTRLRRGP